jgi:hypothetical protein
MPLVHFSQVFEEPGIPHEETQKSTSPPRSKTDTGNPAIA